MSERMDEALRAARWVHPESIAAERNYWEQTALRHALEIMRLRNALTEIGKPIPSMSDDAEFARRIDLARSALTSPVDGAA